MRAIPSWAQWSLAAALGLTLFAVWALQTRADIGVYPTTRLSTEVVVLGASFAVALGLTLRPLHRPPLHSMWQWAVPLACLAWMTVIVTLPPAHTAHGASLVGRGDDLWPRAGACIAVGSSVGVPMILVLALLDRRAGGAPRLFALAAAAVLGLAALQMHCPIVSRHHQWVGHLGLALPLSCVWAILHAWARRR